MRTTQETGIFRKKKTSFTATSNRVLFDEQLDMDTRTLHSMINYYISIPNFTLYKGHIQKQTGLGQRAFNRMWKQLKERGYLVQYKLKDKRGAFYYEYELFDEPQEDKDIEDTPGVQNEPMAENHKGEPEVHFASVAETGMGKAVYEKGSTINKTILNKTISNKTIKNKQQQPKEKDEVVVVNCDAHLPVVDEEVIDQYKHAFGRRPSPKVKESLVSFLSKFDKAVVLYAFEIAGNKGKSFDYAQGILRTWWQQQAFNFDEVFVYEERFQGRME